jgi:Domain of unknown function (DUF1905)
VEGPRVVPPDSLCHYPALDPSSDRTRTVMAGRRRRTVGPTCDAEFVVVVFDAELWIWDARRADSWTFVSLPADASEEIRDLMGGPRRGFGSLRVRVTLGSTTWTTSIFPGSRSSSYVLPIKRPVRTAEALEVGDIATVTVELIDF